MANLHWSPLSGQVIPPSSYLPQIAKVKADLGDYECRGSFLDK